MGPGCAFLDYDGDGWLDILLVNGTNWPGQARRAKHDGPLSQQPQRNIHRRDGATPGYRSRCTEWAWRWAIMTTTGFPICS